ncbi:MAG: EamA family transporter RarD [Pseudomonadota bacterium]
MNAEIRTGFVAALTCYFIWGCLPLYFRALDGLPADEILAHRIIWSVPTGLIFIALANQWDRLRAALTWRRVGWLFVSAILIGANWLVYIWSVENERVMEASLGYYINPLVNVLFGLVLFSERLRALQWASIGLAVIGVGILTLAFGRLPYLALILCFTFAFYTLVRKQVEVDGRAGFLVETAILMPFDFMWWGWLVGQGEAGVMGRNGWDSILLLIAGPLTAVPLICFAIAARRLQLSTIGMIQYLGPTLQFLIAVVVFREPFSATHGIAFVFIWGALALFTADSVMGQAKARRLAQAAESA